MLPRHASRCPIFELLVLEGRVFEGTIIAAMVQSTVQYPFLQTIVFTKEGQAVVRRNRSPRTRCRNARIDQSTGYCKCRCFFFTERDMYNMLFALHQIIHQAKADSYTVVQLYNGVILCLHSGMPLNHFSNREQLPRDGLTLD